MQLLEISPTGEPLLHALALDARLPEDHPTAPAVRVGILMDDQAARRAAAVLAVDLGVQVEVALLALAAETATVVTEIQVTRRPDTLDVRVLRLWPHAHIATGVPKATPAIGPRAASVTIEVLRPAEPLTPWAGWRHLPARVRGDRSAPSRRLVDQPTLPLKTRYTPPPGMHYAVAAGELIEVEYLLERGSLLSKIALVAPGAYARWAQGAAATGLRVIRTFRVSAQEPVWVSHADRGAWDSNQAIVGQRMWR